MAREHVGENILCVDAVDGKVTENNRTKFGYIYAFGTGRYEAVAKEDYGIKYSGKIVKVRVVTGISTVKSSPDGVFRTLDCVPANPISFI